MSCKHVLTHYTKHCRKGREKPCARPRLEGPRTYLPDCCAACDPEFNANKISREHKTRHSKLVEQVNASQHSGTSEEVRRLLDHIQKLTSTTNRAVGEAQHSYSSAADVEFPGVSVPRGTSKWIDGKCVWQEEEPYRLPPYPTETTAPPRLRSTKKGYAGPPEEVPREHVVITGPPRLRTNKPYTGPRESVGIVESREPEEQAAPEMQHHIRRTKKTTENLRHHHHVTANSGSTITPKLDTKRHGNKPNMDQNPRPLKQNYVVDTGEEIDDIWLQLAEEDNKGKASRRIKARMTTE
ncbi:hypothetical protein F4821DRAFT_258372 [Hypoxylon rubiginosum]|uniref:Uncharacterized protein n=1 Tax=Hypoxylon rubiginosum TaxID=110542 RepID=A0ACC0D5J5_9PEZI|nr:hypothetical protein F4821DRAFT_258372 [Hypoxylon rubiginosum]